MGVMSRIMLRYLAGYLVLKNIVPQELADMIANDPELATMVGTGLLIAVEGGYALAKRLGWPT